MSLIDYVHSSNNLPLFLSTPAAKDWYVDYTPTDETSLIFKGYVLCPGTNLDGCVLKDTDTDCSRLVYISCGSMYVFTRELVNLTIRLNTHTHTHTRS